ncbi:MAG: AAA family ATPase [Eubacterium sp.]|nr:AAA family ATPase [Eubacterium sp.]
MDKKKLILITSPPACGKTYVAKNLAKALNNCVYLDKDDLIILSRKIFEVAGEPFDRSSDFFHKWIRDAEYDAIMEVGLDALNYNDTVILNAPFKKEIRDQKWLQDTREKLAKLNAELVLIWIHTDIEVVHQRMVSRNSERDTWKIEHWDEYVATQDYTAPKDVPEMFVFENSSEDEFEKSIGKAMNHIRGMITEV